MLWYSLEGGKAEIGDVAVPIEHSLSAVSQALACYVKSRTSQ